MYIRWIPLTQYSVQLIWILILEGHEQKNVVELQEINLLRSTQDAV
jgi:hypothetical protein